MSEPVKLCVVEGVMARPRPWLLLLVGITLAAAVITFAADVRDLGARLAGVSWAHLGFALALSTCNYAGRWLRWELYLRRQRIAVPRASSVVVFGAGLSLAITPAKLGELAKSLLLRQMHGVPTPQSAPIVLAERVTDLVALLIIAIVGVALYGLAPGLVAAAAAVIGVGLMLLAWPRPARALIHLLTRPRRTRRLRAALLAMYDDLAALCRPGQLVAATAIAVPAWMCECIGFGVIVHAFPETSVPAGLAALIYAATTIAGALSFLPGGLGVTEGAMTLLLVKAGGTITTATAVAATLLTRFATLWFGVLVGLAFMVLARRRISRLGMASGDPPTGEEPPPATPGILST